MDYHRLILEQQYIDLVFEIIFTYITLMTTLKIFFFL